MTDTALAPCNLPTISEVFAWSEPRRGYEPNCGLHRVEAASGVAVIKVYGPTEEKAGERWNAMMGQP